MKNKSKLEREDILMYVGLGLFAIVIIFIILGWIINGEKKYHQIKVLDKAELLSEATIFEIENRIKTPKDIVLVIETIDSISEIEISTIASSMLKKEEHYKIVRPRNFAQAIFDQDPSSSTGIHVIVSNKPKLVQFRFGKRIILEATRAGLAYGKGYSKIQNNFTQLDLDNGTLMVARELSSGIEKSLNLPWYLRWFKNAAVTAYSMCNLDYFPTGFKRDVLNNVLRPYARLSSNLGIIKSPWYFIGFNVMILFVFNALFSFVINLQKNFFTKVLSALLKLSINLLATGIIFTTFLTAFSNRYEDYLFFQQSGISSLLSLSNDNNWFLSNTNFLVAIICALFVVVNRFLTAVNLSESIKKATGVEPDTSAIIDNLGFFSHFILFLFLPSAISIAIAAFNLIKIPAAVVKFANH